MVASFLPPFFLTHSLCHLFYIKVLCIINNFLVLCTICLTSYLVHFKNGPEYLIMGNWSDIYTSEEISASEFGLGKFSCSFEVLLPYFFLFLWSTPSLLFLVSLKYSFLTFSCSSEILFSYFFLFLWRTPSLLFLVPVKYSFPTFSCSSEVLLPYVFFHLCLFGGVCFQYSSILVIFFFFVFWCFPNLVVLFLLLFLFFLLLSQHCTLFNSKFHSDILAVYSYFLYKDF